MDESETMSKEEARLYLSEMFTRLLAKIECAAEMLHGNHRSDADRIARNAQLFALEASRYVIKGEQLAFLPQINHVLAALSKSAEVEDDSSLRAIYFLDSAVAIADAQVVLEGGKGRIEYALSCKRISDYCLKTCVGAP